MKTLITAVLLLLSTSLLAQTKDTTVKKEADTTKLYYLIMPDKKWNELIQLLKTADEKPSVLKNWEQLLLSNITLFKPAPAEEKKK